MPEDQEFRTEFQRCLEGYRKAKASGNRDEIESWLEAFTSDLVLIEFLLEGYKE